MSMATTNQSADCSVPPSPSISLGDFDYDSESPLEQATQPEVAGGLVPQSTSHLPSNVPRGSVSQFSAILPGRQEDVATQSDIASLRDLIQTQFEKLRTHISSTSAPSNPPPPPPKVPTEAITNVLRPELSAQTAKVSALEEETRKLHAEMQSLKAVLDRAEKDPGLRAANQELQRVYVERQGLWDERQRLWDERAGLWTERGDLWRERQSLWDERDALWEEREEIWAERDKLKAQVKSLEEQLERHRDPVLVWI